MPTTLVSFLGRGHKSRPEDPHSDYSRTTYRFKMPDGTDFDQSTSLFGVGLLNYLRHAGNQVDRWIVLGTSGSLWSELNKVLPDPDVCTDEYIDIDDKLLDRKVDEQDLKRWQDTLNHHAEGIELILGLTGYGMDPASQQRIARVLFDNVPPGNELVFDISHGFRHQPVIATFIVSLMRWTHNIRKVTFYSGVYEARENDITPVIELSICQQLIEATEATAILETTGNYEPIGRFLNRDARQAWFLENTNQLSQARKHAAALCSQQAPSLDPAQSVLANLLDRRLAWARESRFAGRVKQSAALALERGDYFRAVILAYEALIILQGQRQEAPFDPLDYDQRKNAEMDLCNLLSPQHKETFRTLKDVRNACAHGTRPIRDEAQKRLNDVEEFKELVREALSLYDLLANNE